MKFFTGARTVIVSREIFVAMIVISICSIFKRILTGVLMVRVRDWSICSCHRSLGGWLVWWSRLSVISLFHGLPLAHRSLPGVHFVIFNWSDSSLFWNIPLTAPAAEPEGSNNEGQEEHSQQGTKNDRKITIRVTWGVRGLIC